MITQRPERKYKMALLVAFVVFILICFLGFLVGSAFGAEWGKLGGGMVTFVTLLLATGLSIPAFAFVHDETNRY